MKKMAASPRRAQLEVELKAKRAELDRMTTEYQSKVNVRKKSILYFPLFFLLSLSLSQPKTILSAASSIALR